MSIPKMAFKKSEEKKELLEFEVLSIDSVQIAIHLALYESNIFCKIGIGELIDTNWLKKMEDKKEDKAPNVREFTRRFNVVSDWIRQEILKKEDLKKRAAVIEKFISVAECCIEIGAFNTVMEVIAAFSSSPVFRLKKTWEAVQKSSITSFDEIKKIFNSENNYTELREEMESFKPPVLPYLGIYLTDLAFIYSNPEKIEGMINCRRLEQIATIILLVGKMQQRPHSETFDADPLLESLLSFERIKLMDNKEAISRSKELE